MSNSAFTPTTTTVTNEVPVNVPVVTDWVAYTPTLTNFGSKGTTLNTAFWRRVGADIEIIFTYQGNATAAGTGTNSLQWSLPSGLTIDSTKIPGAGDTNYLGNAQNYNVTLSAQYSYTNQIVSTTSSTFSILKYASSSAFVTSDLNITRDAYFSGQLKAPISQWAGSGTTTLATRAVEEYAFNTLTSNASDTSSFGNGPDGVVFPNITSTGTTVNKRVRFQSAILPTDSVFIEYQQAGQTQWRQAAARFPQLSQGPTNVYGLELLNVSSTDVDVRFHLLGASPTGSTYGSAGELWSAYFTAGWKWRVRKVSSGAQVGYPVSARNIVGDTSGSVVPTGMLGETKVNSETGTVAPGATDTWASIESITLGRGTWLVTGVGYYFTGAGTLPTGFNQFRCGLSTGPTTSPDEGFYGFIQNPTNVSNGGGSVTAPPRVFTINSDSQQIYLVGYCQYTTLGTLLLNKNQSAIQAVRIA